MLGNFPQPNVTSALAARRKKADDFQGASGKHNRTSATPKLFEIKIFPASD
jgi:hypothetical protein